jgi:serine/threonine protein kinase
MLGLSIRGSRRNNESNDEEETINSILNSGEHATNVTKKELGANAHASKVFFISKGDEKDPSKVLKVTYRVQHPHTWRKTVLEALRYKSLQEYQKWKDYVLPYRGHGENGTFSWIMFDYLAGEDLVEHMAERSRGYAERRRIIAGLLKALKFLAEAGYIHGDLKGDNIWVGDSVRLLDLADTVQDPKPGQIADELRNLEGIIQGVLGAARGRSANRDRNRSRNRSRSRERQEREPNVRAPIETVKKLAEHYEDLIRQFSMRGGKTRRSK